MAETKFADKVFSPREPIHATQLTSEATTGRVGTVIVRQTLTLHHALIETTYLQLRSECHENAKLDTF